ncbi:hypothetical protein [Streptomyces sp. NPDC002952]
MAHPVTPVHRRHGVHAARPSSHAHRVWTLILTFLAVAALLASVMVGV